MTARTKGPTSRSLPQLTTPLPHLALKRALLKAFGGVWEFLRHEPLVFLHGSVINLSPLQTDVLYCLASLLVCLKDSYCDTVY